MTVAEVMQRAMLKLKGPAQCSIYEALSDVQRIIVSRLMPHKSKWLKKLLPYEADYRAGDGLCYMPKDFMALDGRPFIDGEYHLAPLGNEDQTKLPQTTKPRYYQLTLRALQVYPVPTENVVVKVPYLFRPADFTAMTDELPFWGEFDSAFVDGAVVLMEKGRGAITDGAFVALINSQVDSVVTAQEMAEEQQLADAINDL